MEKDKTKVIEVVGTASERAGSFVGKAAALGKRITGVAVGGISGRKEILDLHDEDTEPEVETDSGGTETVAMESELVALRRQLAKSEKIQSKLESQVDSLRQKNNFLSSELEQAVRDVKEIAASEGAVRARAAALESELEAASRQLEQTQGKGGRKKGNKKTSAGTKAELEFELEATKRRLEEIQGQAKKAQSQFESQLEDVQAEKESLLLELEKARKETKEADKKKNRSNDKAGKVAALEAELSATQLKLTETQNHAEKFESQLTSQIKQLQAEKDSLISNLEKSNKKGGKMMTQQDDAEARIAALQSDFDATRRELEELSSQAESAQAELTSEIEKLQSEKNSLISGLQEAQSRACEADAREDALKARIVALESEVAGLRDELNGARESDSGDNATELEELKDFSDAQEEVKEMAAALLGVEKVKSSMDAVELDGYQMNETDQAEPEGVSIENVEEPELGPHAGVESVVYSVRMEEVTAEDVKSADFKNGAEGIIFKKAFSDLNNKDAVVRADAATEIGGIHNELSLRLLVTHIAGEPEAYVRQECVKALTELGSMDGLSTIENALSDGSASVRLAAVWGMYRLAGRESIPVLTRMLSDKDASVRRRAVTCIGWLDRDIGSSGNYSTHKVISALVQCLEDPAVTSAALDALQTITGKKMTSTRTSPERLVKRWQKWWKAELLGQR
jgi:chromosome segregation ATPase